MVFYYLVFEQNMILVLTPFLSLSYAFILSCCLSFSFFCLSLPSLGHVGHCHRCPLAVDAGGGAVRKGGVDVRTPAPLEQSAMKGKQ